MFTEVTTSVVAAVCLYTTHSSNIAVYVGRLQDLKKDPINTLLLFRFTLLNAIYMWLVVLPILTGLIYVVLTPVLRRLMPKSGAKDDKKTE